MNVQPSTLTEKREPLSTKSFNFNFVGEIKMCNELNGILTSVDVDLEQVAFLLGRSDRVEFFNSLHVELLRLNANVVSKFDETLLPISSIPLKQRTWTRSAKFDKSVFALQKYFYRFELEPEQFARAVYSRCNALALTRLNSLLHYLIQQTHDPSDNSLQSS